MQQQVADLLGGSADELFGSFTGSEVEQASDDDMMAEVSEKVVFKLGGNVFWKNLKPEEQQSMGS